MSIYIVGGGAGVFVILNILLIFLEIGSANMADFILLLDFRI